MNLSNISTYALNTNLRLQTMNRQHQLSEAQIEVSTGRKADLGNSLGAFSSSVVSIDNQIRFIRQMEITNSFVEGRLSTMQIGMSSIVENANSFIGQLTAEINGSLDKQLLQTIGQSALESMTSAVNVNFKGEFVFSGVNTDTASLVEYSDVSGSAAKTAVQAAFSATFGFWVGDPAAQSISPTALKSFIDGPFSDLFNDTNWQTLWTGGSERGVRSKISPRELVETPTTANAEAFRKLTAATVLIDEFSNGQLKLSAIDQLANSALELISQGVVEIGVEQAKIGTLEARVEIANQRMAYQQTTLNEQLGELTDVDSYEAAIRLNQIISGLESSYAATARIHSLSLLNYL